MSTFWRGLVARSGPGRAKVTHAVIGDRWERSVRVPDEPQVFRMLARLMALRSATGESAGVVRPIRPQTDEEYPPELGTRMEEREPQFTLRNVPRAERFPDEFFEFDRTRVIARDWSDLVRGVHAQRYEPPTLFSEFALDAVRAYRRTMRHLFFEMPWERHFCRELKKKLAERRVAIWNYDPDAKLDESEDGTVETMPEQPSE